MVSGIFSTEDTFTDDYDFAPAQHMSFCQNKKIEAVIRRKTDNTIARRKRAKFKQWATQHYIDN
jgi:hypothetical protein